MWDSTMRYKSGYKAEKRQELLDISGQIAKKNGFSATGVDSFMKAAGVTEELKAADQMKWVGLANNCRAQAEEIVLSEIIFN